MRRTSVHDRDGTYGEAFDAVFQADDMRVIESAPQAPRTNAVGHWGMIVKRGLRLLYLILIRLGQRTAIGRSGDYQ